MTSAVRFSVVPAAYLIFLRGDEVLLQYRSGTGYRDDHWAVAAAGHVEAGESVLAAGVREAAEELGVTVREQDLVGVTTLHRTNDDPAERRGTVEDERCDYFFLVTAWQGEPRNRQDREHCELRWCSLDEARERLGAAHPEFPPLLARALGW